VWYGASDVSIELFRRVFEEIHSSDMSDVAPDITFREIAN
jgi:hypothetical protein